LSADKVQLGLREVSWLGRFQRIGARHVIDGAHNAAAAAALAERASHERA
jgi:folylpolyglutamate synthase/dihydropteroate synthase